MPISEVSFGVGGVGDSMCRSMSPVRCSGALLPLPRQCHDRDRSGRYALEITGSLKFTWVKLHRSAGAGTNLLYALTAVSGFLDQPTR